jgi:hypothetical protein
LKFLRSSAVAVAGLLAAGTVTAGGMPEPARAAAVIAPLPAEHALLVTGPIGDDFEARIRASLARYPDTSVLVVQSPGGVRYQALKVAELVNARGLTVRIAGRCASACALLWAAADSREMTLDSKLGLHGSRLTVPLPLPDAIREQIVARNDRQTDDVLRGAGFPQSIIAEGGRTPPTSMSWFGPLELKYGGVPFTLRDRGSQPVAASGVAQVAADVARQ